MLALSYGLLIQQFKNKQDKDGAVGMTVIPGATEMEEVEKKILLSTLVLMIKVVKKVFLLRL